MWKQADAPFRPRYGTLAWVAMRNVWLLQLIFAALSPLADLMFLCCLPRVWLARLEHGAANAFVSGTARYVIGRRKLERKATAGVQLCER